MFSESVGSKETQENVSHTEKLFQRVNQLDSCRKLAERLDEAGHPVKFSVFDGGHDADSWGSDLPFGLAWTLGTDIRAVG